MEKVDDYGFELFETNDYPIAYLLTFRTYGTWLRGDERSSVRRNGNIRYGGPKLTASVPLRDLMRETQTREAFTLDSAQRKCVEVAINEVCKFRNYVLRAMNVRTNHAHVVASAAVEPGKIANEFKEYATRRLRSEGLCGPEEKI
jgi:hypothetical protein